MSNKIYARKVLEAEEKLSSELLDVSVEFSRPDKSSGVTDVKIMLPDSNTLDMRMLGSIPVRHPFSVMLNEDNWAEYLYLQLNSGTHNFVDNPMVYPNLEYATIHGFSSLNAYPFIGWFVFKIQSLIGEYFITTKGPDMDTIPTRVCPNVLVIYDIDSVMKNRLVRYNYLGLQTGLQVRSVRDEKPLYYLDFETPLGPKSITYIHYVGMKKVLFGGTEEGMKDFAPAPDWGLLQAAYNDPELNLLPNDRLIHFTFGKFEYFSSLDGKLIFTLHARPIDVAFQAFKTYLDTPASISKETLVDLKHDYNRLTSRYATDGGTGATRKEVLNDCILVFQRIQQSQQ